MEQSIAKDKEGVVSLGAEAFSGLVLGVACYWQIHRVCMGFLTFLHFLPPGLRFK